METARRERHRWPPLGPPLPARLPTCALTPPNLATLRFRCGAVPQAGPRQLVEGARTAPRAVQPPLLPGGRHAHLVRRAAPGLRPVLRPMLPRRSRPPLPMQVSRPGRRGRSACVGRGSGWLSGVGTCGFGGHRASGEVGQGHESPPSSLIRAPPTLHPFLPRFHSLPHPIPSPSLLMTGAALSIRCQQPSRFLQGEEERCDLARPAARRLPRH